MLFNLLHCNKLEDVSYILSNKRRAGYSFKDNISSHFGLDVGCFNMIQKLPSILLLFPLYIACHYIEDFQKTSLTVSCKTQPDDTYQSEITPLFFKVIPNSLSFQLFWVHFFSKTGISHIYLKGKRKLPPRSLEMVSNCQVYNNSSQNEIVGIMT